MPRVVCQNNEYGGQFRITIPLSLVKALGIQPGDKFSFKINSRSNLELVRENAKKQE